MKRYDTYKDSGVQWLGHIPGHWKHIPFRRVAFVKSNLVHPADYMDYSQIAPDSIEKNSGRILHWKSVAESNIESDNHLFFKGQILYSKIRPLLNKVAIAPFDGLCSADMYPIETHQDTKFLLYYMLSSAFLEGVTNATRDRVKMPKINKEELGTIELCIPPLSEQRSIVFYLDDKCGKIDKMLEGKQKQIELLAEMKQRIIADAVTRGLNPDVKMKATNIPWLPEIPEHWEMESLRRFLKIFAEKGHGDKQLLSVTREQGVIERNTDSKEENHNFIPEDLSGYKYVQVGDFVINKMKSWQGSYGVSEYEGIVSPAYFTCKLQDVDKDFFSTAIRSKIYVSFFARYSKGIRVDQWDLSPIALKSIPFALPPLDEQHAIVSYITGKTSKIDILTSKLQQEIESIKEYKQRLISDVVTGQIKVS